MGFNIHKKVAKRAFSGLVGSSFVRISEPIAPPIQTPSQESVAQLSVEIIRKRGRPRQHQDAAARQRACRARKALTVEAKKREAEVVEILRTNYDRKGRISGESSGGYDSDRIASVAEARRLRESGGRVKPKGHGLRSHEETPWKQQPVETDAQFVLKQSFPLEWKLDDRDKEVIVADLTRDLFEIEKRRQETQFDPTVEDVEIQVVLRCPICEMVVNIWSQAANHLREYHPKICRVAIRQMTPKAILRTGECPDSFHRFQRERGDQTCRRCRLNFVTAPEVIKSLKQHEIHFELNVGETSSRETPPGVASAATI